MKLVTFNVNGIRAIIQKDFARDFEALDADIFALNETKFSENDHLSFPFSKEGYEVFWTNSKIKKGYSGVAVFSRIKPLDVHYGLENGEYDDEGRIITLEFENFFFVACYVPNAGENLVRLGFRQEFETRMLDYLKKLDQVKPVIYAGDLNVAHQPIDLKNPAANQKNPGYTIEERTSFQNLLDAGFIDAFRHLYKDKVIYSWWSYRFQARLHNAGWRIDYFIVSKRLIDKVEDVIIHNEIMGSDHCPVELIIKE